MATTTVKRRVEVVNPPRRKKVHAAKNRGKRTRRNAGEIVTLGLLGNPAKKKGKRTMAKVKRNRAKRSRKNSTIIFVPRRRKAARARTNGFFSRKHRRRARRNPGIGGEMTGTVVTAGWTIAGAVGSRVATQFILGANNTGWAGYGMNAGVSLGLYFVAKHLMRDQRVASAILVGGTVGLGLRMLSDLTPFGQWVSSNFSGLGDYQATTFFVPAVPNNAQSTTDASMQLPASINSSIAAAKAALLQSANAAKGHAAPKGMGRAGVNPVAISGGRYGTQGRYA